MSSTPGEARAAGGLRDLLVYFLRLGTFGFGGPVALVGYMQRDLVERRRWITHDDYVRGLALAQLAPGPLAAQLAIYLGWVRAGIVGATSVAVAFILPSFAMVLALSWAYVRAGGLPWMQAVFYGVAAAVIAIIARSAWKLVRLTLGRDRMLWALFTVNAVITAWTATEIVWVFIASGLVAWLVKAPPRRHVAAMTLGATSWLTTGLHGAQNPRVLVRLAGFFAEAGAFVFGSGLAIVPFLHGGVVGRFHWLDERQFLDAVAVAMITPGPVVITVAFIGYLVAGSAGAVAAALGVFLPCYLLVIIPAPHYRRFADNRVLKAVVSGVTAAATGAIAGAVIVLGRRAVIDVPTIAIAVAAFAVLTWGRRLPEPIVIAAAGVAGVIIKHFAA
ncbi:MAG TPA: chromate efflux transporter [Candidatus Eisenbacteria bacterium]|nr:chromate efflux transporter [Candidatus Eisenbacteria bacterium]